MKTILIIIGLALNVSLMSAQSWVTVKLDSVCDPPAGLVIVSCKIEVISNPGGNNLISSYGINIQYDGDVLGDNFAFVNFNPIFPLSNYLINIVWDVPEPGWNTIILIYAAAVSGTGYNGMNFFDLEFNYIGPPASSDLLLSGSGMSDDLGNPYDVTYINGYVGPCLVGIQEIKPDPFNIRCENGNIHFNAEAVGEFSLYNLFGQQVLSAAVHPGLNVIPLKDNNAFYLVRIVTNNKTITQKIFVP